MTWHPSYKLYASDGLTLVHSFDYILSDNSPMDALQYTEITGFRGQGSLIIPGSTQPWDLQLTFFLCKADYAALISAMDAMNSTIVIGTPYVLKIDRTISTTKDYNVKRLQPIAWEDTKRVKYQKGNIIFRVNCW